ncbi:hypothetical protein [Winogradskyella sp.]|uniref:hypothetical protein n=1 Tax=Winogradskyella sp. TaxID=1883156 RepID=UPI0026057D5F|nr:hypothetical protein [Winogradskyella sp.]
MKFKIDHNNRIEDRTLEYLPNECSFNMFPIVENIDFELILNKISLSVRNNRIIQLWGFCGLGDRMISNYTTPKYEKGDLIIEETLENGFAYSINDNELPVFININTGWVCIGNPIDNPEENTAVEFIKNCVAIINSKGKLISLWLKPERLPKMLKVNIR